MTATERLRALLDERGVEWTYSDGTVSFDNGERWFHAWAYNDGAMCVSMGYLTPEQAIEATLGTVHRKTHTKEYCNRCEGAVLPKWKKCPWCGEPLEEV